MKFMGGQVDTVDLLYENRERASQYVEIVVKYVAI